MSFPHQHLSHERKDRTGDRERKSTLEGYIKKSIRGERQICLNGRRNNGFCLEWHKSVLFIPLTINQTCRALIIFSIGTRGMLESKPTIADKR